MSRQIWIAIPAYTGQIHLGTMRSIFADTLKLAERGDRVTIFDESGNALLADCRALIAAKFLDGTDNDDDALALIDHDVVWPAGKLMKLVDDPVDCRVGIYPQRCDPINYCMRQVIGPKYLIADKATGLLEIAGAPLGFTVVSRRMLKKMVEHYRDLEFWCDDAPSKKVCGLFESYWIKDALLPDGSRGTVKLGEDYAFCQRWLDIGGQVWVDPEIKMGHVGFKTFVGSLGDHLREKWNDHQRQQLTVEPMPAPQWELPFQPQPNGVDDYSDLTTLLPQAMREFA